MIVFYIWFILILYYVFYRTIKNTQNELKAFSSETLNQNKWSFVWITLNQIPKRLYMHEYTYIGFLSSLPTQLLWDFTVNNVFFQTFNKLNKGAQIVSNKMLLLEYARKKKSREDNYNYIHLHQDKRQSLFNTLMWYWYWLSVLIIGLISLFYISIKSDKWNFVGAIITFLHKHTLSPVLVVLIIAIFFMIISRLIQKKYDHRL